MSGLSGEDRARLETHSGYLRTYSFEPGADEDADAIDRAFALIDQQAKALEAADELADAALIVRTTEAGLTRKAHAYRFTRTTTEEEAQ